MTTSNWKKAFTQLNVKPNKKKKYIKHNSPKERAHGVATKTCVRCGTTRAVIGKYSMNICRRCLRDTAQNLGFKKYR